MNNAKRWQEFLKFWRETSPKAHLYDIETLVKVIEYEINRIKKG